MEINEKSYQLLVGRYMIRENKIKQTLFSKNSFGKFWEKKSVIFEKFYIRKGIESNKALGSHKNKEFKLLRLFYFIRKILA